ncbi:hypothetical protein [Rhodococcus sp. NPDC049939]|uniref:hypothetical protein n=1 Tax=Rhodococcus sp. NPDC049939 TaxID=3155511 RepID=UPI0033E3AEFD
MIKKFLVASALAAAVSIAVAPAAQAQDHVPPPGYELAQNFVTPLYPGAWVPFNIYPKAVVFSPFGTDNIYCQSFKVTTCYQLDPAGNPHDLVKYRGPFRPVGSPQVWFVNIFAS